MTRNGRRRPPTMAELAEAVRAEPVAPPPSEPTPCAVEVDGRRFAVVDDGDLTPEAALALASDGSPVIWDSCGCGGGCGYRTWVGREVADLTRTGVPRVRAGALYELRAADGHVGVLVEGDVRWGSLR